MSEIKVIHISKIQSNYFAVSAPKRNQLGGLRVDVDYKDPAMNGCIYLIQTPKLRLPFGMNVREHENRANSYSLALSFDNFKNNSPVEIEFVRGIQLIDERIKKLACENSKEWFKKTMKQDVIDELFRPSIKYSDEWPPLFTAKLPYYNEKFTCDFYDQNRTKCTGTSTVLNSVSTNCNAIALIQLNSLWFVDKQFGCTWSIKQCQIFPSPSHEMRNSFLINNEEDDDCAED